MASQLGVWPLFDLPISPVPVPRSEMVSWATEGGGLSVGVGVLIKDWSDRNVNGWGRFMWRIHTITYPSPTSLSRRGKKHLSLVWNSKLITTHSHRVPSEAFLLKTYFVFKRVCSRFGLKEKMRCLLFSTILYLSIPIYLQWQINVQVPNSEHLM